MKYRPKGGPHPSDILKPGSYTEELSVMRYVRGIGWVAMLPFKTIAFAIRHPKLTAGAAAIGLAVWAAPKVVENFDPHTGAPAGTATAPRNAPSESPHKSAPKPTGHTTSKPKPTKATPTHAALGPASPAELLKRELAVAQSVEDGHPAGMPTDGFTTKRLSGTAAATYIEKLEDTLSNTGEGLSSPQAAEELCSPWAVDPALGGDQSRTIATDLLDAQKSHVNENGGTFYPPAFYTRAAEACGAAITAQGGAHPNRQIVVITFPAGS